MKDIKEEKVDLRLSHDAFYKKYGRKKIVSTYTLGCKVNQYETEAMEELFEESGYAIGNFSDAADIYVVNTCTVTNIADKKSRQMLSKARKKNQEAVIVAVGCYAQIAGEKLQADYHIDLIIGSNHKNKVVELVESYLLDGHPIQVVDDIGQTTDYEDIWITKVSDKTRAYIKIQDGCNQFCSYCIIPYTRGRIRSREIGDIIKEVKTLAQNGYHEVVLTGIHIGSYGKDQDDHVTLLGLLNSLHTIEGIQRIRLGSLEPNLITADFLAGLVQLNKVCPHFHLSLQSGCDTVLKRMNRKYSTSEYADKVGLIRDTYANPSITTDIIVGFPGETEGEFQETLDFIKRIQFSHIHVFKYSMREGTPAAERTDQIDAAVKAKRSQTIIACQDKITRSFLETFMNKDYHVLYEEKIVVDDTSYYYGFTDNYIKVKTASHTNIQNKLLPTRIIAIQENMLIGEI